MKSLSGHLLIAEPRLPDSNFFRSVVLMIEHSEKGASGLILNRPSGIQLSEIWDNVSDSQLSRDETIHIGGPVEGPLSILHRCPNNSERELFNGVFLSMRRNNLTDLLKTNEQDLRVFSGYSGWGPGQLENEMSVGGWLTFPAAAEHVFGDIDLLYRLACDSVSQETLFGKTRPRHAPSDPTLN